MATLIDVDELCDTIARARVVAPVGGRTHWEVGGPPPSGDDVTFVRAPAGIVTYEPADLTVTVGAGTTCGELAAVLGAAGQACAPDPRDTAAPLAGPPAHRRGPPATTAVASRCDPRPCRRWRRGSTGRECAGSPRWAWARCTSRPTTPPRWRPPAPRRPRPGVGCCARPGRRSSTASAA